MKPAQKLLTTCLWVIAVLAMVSVIGAGLWNRHRDRGGASAVELLAEDPGRKHLDPIADVPEFSLVDQNNKPMTRAALLGKPWVACFIFTHCAGPCPEMTKKMAAMQSAITDSAVHFVSFSVDPQRDTPAVLKQYAAAHHADESRWHFLTGDQDAIFAVARGMLISAVPAQGKDEILHSTKFLLVDSAGKIRQFYDSGDLDEMARLRADAQRLAAETKATR